MYIKVNVFHKNENRFINGVSMPTYPRSNNTHTHKYMYILTIFKEQLMLHNVLLLEELIFLIVNNI